MHALYLWLTEQGLGRQSGNYLWGERQALTSENIKKN